MFIERIRTTINILAALTILYLSFLAFLYYARSREGSAVTQQPGRLIQMKSAPSE